MSVLENALTALQEEIIEIKMSAKNNENKTNHTREAYVPNKRMSEFNTP